MDIVEKEKLSDKVTLQIMEMITIQNRFKAGDKLPNENELSEELNVSRTTLREAVNNLVAQNVLEKKRGCGTYVVDNKKLTNDLGFNDLNYMHVRLSDLYELRLMLEPQIAGIAAQKATDEEIEEIAAYADMVGQENLSNDQIIEYNRKFHDSIASATHNEFIIRLINNINTAVVKEFDINQGEEINSPIMMMSHKMVIDYLRLHDADGATQAMRLHLKYSVKNFK